MLRRAPELVLLVESLRSGQACLLEPDPALLGEAERIAEALRLRGLDSPAEQAVAVHLDSLEHSRVRSVGCERLALHALDQLGLQAALRAQGVSARGAGRRPHGPSLFDTPAAIVFYDLTNVHYHGRPGGDMQFGRSKQKRSDCPLATLALALDGAGFPRCSEGDETHLRVWSQQRQQKDEAIVVRRRERFEAEVRALHAGLARKGCTKRYDKVLERLGRLKERYRQVAGQYDIAVERGSGQGHAAQLAEIEAAFRSLKGETGLRPIFHVKPRRACAPVGRRSAASSPAGSASPPRYARPTAAGSSAARTPARMPKPQNWPRLSAWRRACIACAPATRPMPRRHRLPRNNPRP